MLLDHIVLLLSDLPENIRFYDALLPLIGFEKKRDHVFANSSGLHLDFRQAEKPEHGYERYAPGLNHLGFTATSHQTLIDIQQKMKAKGFEVPDIQSFKDGTAIFFKDSEGMRIEIGAYD